MARILCALANAAVATVYAGPFEGLVLEDPVLRHIPGSNRKTPPGDQRGFGSASEDRGACRRVALPITAQRFRSRACNGTSSGRVALTTRIPGNRAVMRRELLWAVCGF